MSKKFFPPFLRFRRGDFLCPKIFDFYYRKCEPVALCEASQRCVDSLCLERSETRVPNAVATSSGIKVYNRIFGKKRFRKTGGEGVFEKFRVRRGEQKSQSLCLDFYRLDFENSISINWDLFRISVQHMMTS